MKSWRRSIDHKASQSQPTKGEGREEKQRESRGKKRKRLIYTFCPYLERLPRGRQLQSSPIPPPCISYLPIGPVSCMVLLGLTLVSLIT